MGRWLSEALLLAFDTETTGVDPASARVVEIGACYHQGGARVASPLRVVVDPGEPIPEGASAVHGITDDDVRGAPSFGEVADRLAARLFDSEHPPILVGYNARDYDAPLLNAELERAGRPERIDPARVVDPIWWIRWHLRAHSGRLGDVCSLFGVPLESAHAAWADAAATAELLARMVRAMIIPDDVEEALGEQALLARRIEEEREAWAHYFYRREDGLLRLGFGKWKGKALAEVPSDYFRFVLRSFEGVPEAVRRIMEGQT